MLKAFSFSRVLSIRFCGGSLVEKMPGKRKAEATGTKDDDKKKNKAGTDWESLDFGSKAKTEDKKVKKIS